MSDADLTALVAMLRQIQCEPVSFDTYSMASAAERAADAIERLRSSSGACAEPAAWMAEDGRVIPAETKRGADRDGGAIASGAKVYSIPLYRTAPEPSGECICPKCGLRHGGTNIDGGF